MTGDVRVTVWAVWAVWAVWVVWPVRVVSAAAVYICPVWGRPNRAVCPHLDRAGLAAKYGSALDLTRVSGRYPLPRYAWQLLTGPWVWARERERGWVGGARGLANYNVCPLVATCVADAVGLFVTVLSVD